MEVNFGAIEKKWQARWEADKIFEVSENSSELTRNNVSSKLRTKVPSSSGKFYVLEMFPYPSGTGLHMGHALNYTIGDILARFKIMKGFEVLHPMGYDALGLPAENAAIKAGTHPEEYTNNSIKNFIKQTKALGVSYDWSRIVNTASPDYYKWDQWIFLKMLEKGLAYQKEASVNWCPKCDTVLANEQVTDGKCWRHEDTDVEVKKLKQWFFKTTAYADELLDGLKSLEWPERTKIMQGNWIGRSEGTEISFDVNEKGWKVFTTRPDTIFGVTFMVVAAGHERLDELITPEQRKDVDEFLRKIKSVSEKDIGKLDKDGVFTGSYAVNPATGEKVPVWVGNFVLADYGSGMVMAVPAHDKRDFEFAKKYGIPIKQVVAPLFLDKEGADAVREDKETIERDAIFGIVKHWEKDEYYCLDWKSFGWKSFVIGGVKKGEAPEDAAVREVMEETGYQDIKSVKRVGLEVHSNFFAHHKDINRYGKFKAVLVELGSGKWIKPEEEHVKNHDGEWVAADKVSSYLNLDNNKYAWNELVSGGAAYVDDGVLINSGEFDGTRKLLATLGKIKVLADKENVDFWVIGSLAAAFHVGKIYKNSSDVDLITKDEKNKEALCGILERMGCKKILNRKLSDDLTIVIYENEDGVQIDVGHFVGGFGLKEEDFETKEREVEGLRCKVLSRDFCISYKKYWMSKRDKESDKLDLSVLEGGAVPDEVSFDKMSNVEAKAKITDWLADRGVARRVINFKLRDWGVSRQRYWGTPIPIIYCDDCGVVAVPENELPVVLPKEVKFGKGNPLESNEEWLNAACPKCGAKGRREADSMDTFVNSSWYFLRYADPNNSERIFDFDKAKYWNPVDVYIGGAEHACMHLLYARFYLKFLRDIGMVDYDEPFTKLFHQGMLHAEDGRKMSKSLGNVVDPLDTIAKYGVDATRWFLISVASPDKNFDWSEKGILGSVRFIKRVFAFYEERKDAQDSAELVSKLNLAIKNLEEYYGNFDYRKATIEIRELFDLIESHRDDPKGPKGCSKETALTFLKLIAPICPHTSEELWERMGGKNFISVAAWPEVDEKKILKKGEVGNLNGKIVERILGIMRDDVEKVYVYVMPFELGKVDAVKISEGVGKAVEVFAVNDSSKVDPKGMSKKAKPGMAAIYLE